MKYLIKISLLIMVLSSCSYSWPESDSFGNAGSSLGGFSRECILPIGCDIEEIIKSSKWKITYFYKSGKDDSLKFEKNEFVFGLFMSPMQGLENLGGWRIDSDFIKENYLLEDIYFEIFNLSNEFEVLNNQWHFIAYSESKIELVGIVANSNENNYLTFKKTEN